MFTLTVQFALTGNIVRYAVLDRDAVDDILADFEACSAGSVSVWSVTDEDGYEVDSSSLRHKAAQRQCWEDALAECAENGRDRERDAAESWNVLSPPVLTRSDVWFCNCCGSEQPLSEDCGCPVPERCAAERGDTTAQQYITAVNAENLELRGEVDDLTVEVWRLTRLVEALQAENALLRSGVDA